MRRWRRAAAPEITDGSIRALRSMRAMHCAAERHFGDAGDATDEQLTTKNFKIY